MECETYKCVRDRLNGRSSSNNSENIARDEDDDLFSTSSSFRILFPIILVIGIFTLVAVGVLVQRIMVKVIQKRWRSRRHRRSVRPRGRTLDSNPSAGVNTISRNYSDLPSYGQVMAAIKQGEAPPPYCEVVTGSVNPAFLGQHYYRSHLQSPSNDVIRQANSQWSTRDRATLNSMNQTPSLPNSRVFSDVDIINEAQNSSTVINIPQSPGNPGILHSLPQEDSLTSNVTTIGPSVYRSSVPPVEQPVSIVIHDIDELVNSISVPSALKPGNDHVKKNRKSKQPKRNEACECPNSSSLDNCAPKTSSNTSSNNGNEGTIVLESTPV